MAVYQLGDDAPHIHESAYVAPEAAVIGRVKLGVKGENREESDLADYVLRPFEPGERAIVEPMIDLGAEAVEAVVASGIEAAMNLFNGRSAAPA